MASIMESAAKVHNERQGSDVLRIQAGHMLMLDEVGKYEDMASTGVMRKVLRQNKVRDFGCVALPLTIAYFTFYCISASLHEDITDIFLAERPIREKCDEMFSSVQTIDELWGVLKGDFADFFMKGTDVYGQPVSNASADDIYGTSQRVLTYNQIQGAIQFDQTRRSRAPFGGPYNCTNTLTCALCQSQDGFLRVGLKGADTSSVAVKCDGTRRLEEEAGSSAQAGSGDGGGAFAGLRRLALLRPELASSFPNNRAKEEDRFRVWALVADGAAGVRERLNYYQSRSWLDEGTDHLEIKLYLLNVEMGRPQIEQLMLQFYFSEAGGIYYRREFQAIFLLLFPSDSGVLILASDMIWVTLLGLSTAFYLWLMWKEFLQMRLIDHLLKLYTAWEWLILLAGWSIVYGFYVLYSVQNDVSDKLKKVRELGDGIQYAQLNVVEDFFEAAYNAAFRLSWVRVLFADYTIILMFRFFVTFDVQPRLAVVTKTLKAMLTDIVHFMIVFLPVVMAYTISGSLLFGRRIEALSTIQSSFGALVRMSFESEYNWETMSSEFYWTSGFWIWSFIVVVVFLMLNMVLAIVLDVYREVSQHTASSEAVWESVYHYLMNLANWRSRVPGSRIHDALSGGGAPPVIRRCELEDLFPRIKEPQLDQLFSQCHRSMVWESQADLDDVNLLKLSGSMMVDIQKTGARIDRVNRADGNPLGSWTTTARRSGRNTIGVGGPLAADTKGGARGKMFLSSNVYTKGHGSQCPSMRAPGEERPDDDKLAYAGRPAWLKEVEDQMAQHGKWLELSKWHVGQMQWQVQVAQTSRSGDSERRAVY